MYGQSEHPINNEDATNHSIKFKIGKKPTSIPFHLNQSYFIKREEYESKAR